MTVASLHGRRLGLSNAYDNLVSNGTDITSKVADAVITVSAEGATVANQRDITIQLKDAKGNDIDYVAEVEIGMFLTADRLAYVVTGGSTGIAIGTDGALLALVAKKRFVATSEADGDIDLTWTDTGTEAAFLGVKLPSGRYVMSAALANT
jgi:phage protein D